MSLTYRSLMTLVRNADEMSDEKKRDTIDYLSRLYLIPTPELFYPFLFGEVNYVEIKIDRNDRFGINIEIAITVNGNKIIVLFHRKRKYDLSIFYMRNQDNSDLIDSIPESTDGSYVINENMVYFANPSLILALLLINKLPKHIADYLIDYILKFSDRDGNILNLNDILASKFMQADEISEWKISNHWPVIREFGLKLFELLTDENYPETSYPIELDLRLSKYNVRSQYSYQIRDDIVSINAIIDEHKEYLVIEREDVIGVHDMYDNHQEDYMDYY